MLIDDKNHTKYKNPRNETFNFFKNRENLNKDWDSYKNVCVIADDCSYESSYSSEIEKCHFFNKFNFR